MPHDFSVRLSQFDRWRRRMYSRGFMHGVMFACGAMLFFAWYLSVGAQS